MYKFLLLSALCAVAAAQYGHEAPHEDYYTEPHYAYEYSVHDPHTGDIHSQKEERKGDVTQGEYSLVEADGSKRLVQYQVHGKSGFVAAVQKGEGYDKPSYYKPSYSEPSYSKPSYYKEATYEKEYKYSQPSYSHSSYSASSSYKSAPSYYKPAPSYEYKPAPSYNYEPAPSYYKPAPSYYKPAPSYYKPAPSYSYEPAPAYKPSYSSAPAYKPSYDGHGAATSSVSFATHGAKITTSTKHIVPPPKHY